MWHTSKSSAHLKKTRRRLNNPWISRYKPTTRGWLFNAPVQATHHPFENFFFKYTTVVTPRANPILGSTTMKTHASSFTVAEGCAKATRHPAMPARNGGANEKLALLESAPSKPIQFNAMKKAHRPIKKFAIHMPIPIRATNARFENSLLQDFTPGKKFRDRRLFVFHTRKKNSWNFSIVERIFNENYRSLIHFL